MWGSRGQAQRLGGGGAARIHRLWGQAGIILLSGTQKAASPMVPVIACAFILSTIVEHLLYAGLAWALAKLQWMRLGGL